jgi:hypothetical protein
MGMGDVSNVHVVYRGLLVSFGEFVVQSTTEIGISKNAYPVILEGTLKARGIACPILSAYTASREENLSVVMNAFDVEREVAKMLFIVSLHGGEWNNNANVPAGARHGLLDAFAIEARHNAQALVSRDEYADIWDIVQHDPERTNKMGSFVAFVWQVAEDKAISAIETSLKQQGRQVDVLVFDSVRSRTISGRSVNVVELSRLASEALRGLASIYPVLSNVRGYGEEGAICATRRCVGLSPASGSGPSVTSGSVCTTRRQWLLEVEGQRGIPVAVIRMLYTGETINVDAFVLLFYIALDSSVFPLVGCGVMWCG